MLGTLCLLDTQPRTLSPRDVMLLQNMADDVMRAVRQQQNQRYGGVADEGPALALP